MGVLGLPFKAFEAMRWNKRRMYDKKVRRGATIAALETVLQSHGCSQQDAATSASALWKVLQATPVPGEFDSGIAKKLRSGVSRRVHGRFPNLKKRSGHSAQQRLRTWMEQAFSKEEALRTLDLAGVPIDTLAIEDLTSEVIAELADATAERRNEGSERVTRAMHEARSRFETHQKASALGSTRRRTVKQSRLRPARPSNTALATGGTTLYLFDQVFHSPDGLSLLVAIAAGLGTMTREYIASGRLTEGQVHRRHYLLTWIASQLDIDTVPLEIGSIRERLSKLQRVSVARSELVELYDLTAGSDEEAITTELLRLIDRRNGDADWVDVSEQDLLRLLAAIRT